jgi:hypothetical protein
LDLGVDVTSLNKEKPALAKASTYL